MLTTGIVLGLASAGMELIAYWRLPWMRQLLARWEFAGLVLSFGLSILLGNVFDAHGVTALLGGVLSTVLVQPVYWYQGAGKEQVGKWKAQLQTRLTNSLNWAAGNPLPSR